MPHVAIVARVTVKAGRADEYLAAFGPVFTELIAAADVTIGETLMAKGLGG